ncbi:MMPL family transporter [Spongiibacter tropicus]|uniref:efflux RND transporter permease subunit n=2 Tax=Spongiibacter TaxID=630749 RepID=UPI0023540B8C|nr:MMPL family transporter [Spongiibacter tropicus]|tara:strand:- start:12518 stop:15085 length:2568 start_codon:yes stop_codon:yes gene_type:complete
MTARLAGLYQTLILRNALWVLILLFGLIAFLGSYVPQMKLDASSEALVLEGDTSLDFFREIGKRYQTEEFLLVTYQPEADLYAPETLDTLAKLRDELAELPGVSSINSILDVPLLQSPPVSISDVTSGNIPMLSKGTADVEMAREEFANSPIYRSLLTSPDGSTTALQVNLQRDERYFELVNERDALRQQAKLETLSPEQQAELERVENIFDDYVTEVHERQEVLVAKARDVLDGYRDGARLFLGGVPMISVDMIDFVKSDLKVFGSGILAFIIFLLLVIFRSPRWVLIPLLNCVATVVFMMGLLAFLDWRLTVISANFVALLLIITLAITIHLVVRYREIAALSPSSSQMERVSETVRVMAKPCFYTALTTLVAFASLVISGIRPVIDFGWMMTMGVTSALLLSFLILPCILMLLPTRDEKGGDSGDASLTLYFARATERFGGTIITVSLVMLVASAWGISQLKVENRFIDYFHEDTEIYQGMETIDAELGGTIGLDVILDRPDVASAPSDGGEFDDAFSEDFSNADDFAPPQDDFADDFGEDFGDDFGGGAASSPQSEWFTVAGMRRIKEVHDYLDSLPETGKVLSLATFYELMQLVMGNVDDLQLALAQRSLPESITNILVDPYLSVEADQARISLRVKETSHSLHRDQLLKDVRQHLIDELGFEEDQVRLTGLLVLYNNMLQSLFTSQILTLAAVFVAILAMFVVLFRSFSLAMIALTPNLLAAGAVLGGMGLVGIPLDMMTITIAAITVGIGVDDTIHYVHRFRSEFPKDRNYLATMYRCHGSIGKAMYYTSVIIVFGFSILALSNFTPSIYFGLLTGLAMVAALMGAMLLLPKLILLVKPLGAEDAHGR